MAGEPGLQAGSGAAIRVAQTWKMWRPVIRYERAK
jgi:hypothetical protein